MLMSMAEKFLRLKSLTWDNYYSVRRCWWTKCQLQSMLPKEAKLLIDNCGVISECQINGEYPVHGSSFLIPLSDKSKQVSLEK